MEFEDRVRLALKQHAKDIEVDVDVRQRIAERIEQAMDQRFEQWSGLRKLIIGTGLAGILLIGANTAVLAATGRSLLDVLVHTNYISPGDGMISGWAFIPAGGKSPTANQPPAQDTGSRPMRPSTPVQVKPGHPVVAHAVEITGPIVDGNQFTDVRYDQALIEPSPMDTRHSAISPGVEDHGSFS